MLPPEVATLNHLVSTHREKGWICLLGIPSSAFLSLFIKEKNLIFETFNPHRSLSRAVPFVECRFFISWALGRPAVVWFHNLFSSRIYSLPLTILMSNFLTLEPTSNCSISLQCNFLAYIFVFIFLSVIEFVIILLLFLRFGFSATRHVQT